MTQLVKIEGRRMDDRGWDALMASPTWWTFSNASSGSWWWTGKPGVLQSMGYQTQLSNWTELTMWSFHFLSSDHLTLFICKSFSLEKEMAPTPVSLPGKFHGWRSLADYSPWDHKKSDTTEWLQAILCKFSHPAFFWLLFGMSFHLFIFSLCVFLNLHWVSYRYYVTGFLKKFI